MMITVLHTARERFKPVHDYFEKHLEPVNDFLKRHTLEPQAEPLTRNEKLAYTAATVVAASVMIVASANIPELHL